MTLREARPSAGLEIFLLFQIKETGDNATLRKRVEELQETLEQATKGIAALAAAP